LGGLLFGNGLCVGGGNDQEQAEDTRGY
jgi:hypothetical protein